MTSSVQWLIKEIEKHDKEFSSFYGAEIEQALAKEKAQHQFTWDEAKFNTEISFEQHYSETFKKD